ncbi:PE family protein [Mycobacterium sp. UM_CSW]|uniref:PE family protein n=1 Tax=Mycobacterium sp. UM_CSW TaxID=1370119 RepID=UPI0004056C9B|nr:PE family protein [Mycobacterium sp. UM_CSW]
MSAVIAVPEAMSSAATDLVNIGLNLNAAHAVAATPTLAVLPPAADEISTGVAQLFAQHAQGYQALAGQAAAFHDQFVQHLTAGAGAYATGEAANVALLAPITDVAGSIGAVGGLPGQAIGLFNTVGSQLLNTIGTFRGALVTALTPVLAITAFIAIIAIIVAAVLIVQLLNGAGFNWLLTGIRLP